MLKGSEVNVLYALIATTLVGLTGMGTSFGREINSNSVLNRQNMNEILHGDTKQEKDCVKVGAHEVP